MKKLTFYLKLVIISCLLSAFFSSCENEESDQISLNVSSKTLNFEDEFQIVATSNQHINYTVEDSYHACISEEGLLTARYVGQTRIFLKSSSDEKIFNLTVEPLQHTYPEPDIKFGQSKDSLISVFGPDYTESNSRITYSDYSTAAPILILFFDENDKLTTYAIMVETMYSIILVDFLMERYPLVDEDKDTYYFADGLTSSTITKTIIFEKRDTSYWMVLYCPYTSSSSCKKEMLNW